MLAKETSQQPIKLLLVEDDQDDALLTKEVLDKNKSKEFHLTHKSSLSDAISELSKEHFDEILLDLNLPDSQGIDTFQKIRSLTLNTPIVVMTGISDEEVATKAIHEGAQDYLIKEEVYTPQCKSLINSLCYAIERNKQFVERLKAGSQTKKLDLPITNREREILWLVSEGKTNKEVAKELSLSLSTVRNHISHIFRKLGTSNRTQAASTCFQNNPLTAE